VKKFMKKILLLVISITLIAAGSAFGIVAGSRHDMTFGALYAGSVLSSCQYCHTPHLRNNPLVGAAPLWNRSVSGAGSYLASDGATSYQVYGAAGVGGPGGTLSGTTVGAPGGNSKTCLSCHDGTIGLGAVIVGAFAAVTGVEAGGTAVTVGVGGALIDGNTNTVTGRVPGLGTDLRQEHPVGVVYDSGTTGPGLSNVIAALPSGLVYEVNGTTLRIYGAGGDGFSTVECGSCHDPHVTGGGFDPFLRQVLTTICTDCHSAK
jgi:predicted CXXCH cytochrome family protein